MLIKRKDFFKACTEVYNNRGEKMSNIAQIALYYLKEQALTANPDQTRTERKKQAYKLYK